MDMKIHSALAAAFLAGCCSSGGARQTVRPSPVEGDATRVLPSASFHDSR